MNSRSSSGYHGVYFQRMKIPLRKPWKAYYRRHGEQVCVGYYGTKEEAAKAYNRAVENLRHAKRIGAKRSTSYPLNSL